jgi:hypothetical protein
MIFIDRQNRLSVIDCDIAGHRGRGTIFQGGPQMRDQFGTFEDNETIVEGIALVGFRKARGDDTGDAFEFQRRRSLFATPARSNPAGF